MKTYLDQDYIAVNGTILAYTGKEASVTVANQLADMPVNAIGEFAFSESNTLEQITLPPCVTSIGSNAFYSSSQLKYIHLSGTMQHVAHQAFTHGIRRISVSDICINKQEYRKLKASALACKDGIYLCTKIPEIPLLSNLLSAFDCSYPHSFPLDADALFLDHIFNQPYNQSNVKINPDQVLTQFHFRGTAAVRISTASIPGCAKTVLSLPSCWC